MKKGLKSFGKGIGFVLLFLALQVVATVLCSIVAGGYYGATHAELATDQEALQSAYAEWYNANLANFTSIATFVGGVLTVLILLISKKVGKKSFARDFSFHKVSAGLLGKSLLLGFGLNGVVGGILSLLPESVLENYGEAAAVFVDSGFVVRVLMGVVAAPFVEEIIFRAGAFKTFRQGMPKALAVILSACIFGLCHGTNPVWFCYATLLGVVLALVFDKTGSILPGYMIHLAFNATSTLIFGNVESDMVAVVLIIICVIAAIAGTILIVKDQTNAEKFDAPVLVKAE